MYHDGGEAIDARERRSTVCLAGIYAFRMLGLFMVLPVFSLYAPKLEHANATLVGIALGIYGLTQAFLQIPFGMASDRLGRKPIIILGLLLFIIGSIVAALTNSISGMILGRALQGAGAVGSTLIALLADNTKDEHRLKAMSLIGMTIGFAFIIAMMMGPILNRFIGLSGIFWFTAFLGMIGLLLLSLIPSPKQLRLHRDSEAVIGQFKTVLRMPELLRLDTGIFCLHAILMALFLVIPTLLLKTTHLALTEQWQVYLPVLVIATGLMFPFIIIAEAKRLIKPIFMGAIGLISLSTLLFIWLHHSLFAISILLCLFFTAFTILEGLLPSLISKVAPVGSKGTAMGIYSSAQFLGIFFGGSLGGLIISHFGLTGIFIFTTLLGCFWLLAAVTMIPPRYLSSRIIALSQLQNADLNTLKARLLTIKGIFEVLIVPDEQVVYLKLDKKIFNAHDLQLLLKS